MPVWRPRFTKHATSPVSTSSPSRGRCGYSGGLSSSAWLYTRDMSAKVSRWVATFDHFPCLPTDGPGLTIAAWCRRQYHRQRRFHQAIRRWRREWCQGARPDLGWASPPPCTAGTMFRVQHLTVCSLIVVCTAQRRPNGRPNPRRLTGRSLRPQSVILLRLDLARGREYYSVFVRRVGGRVTDDQVRGVHAHTTRHRDASS